MKTLKRFYLRYYPPGIAMCYENEAGAEDIKMIDLLNLTTSTNIKDLANELIKKESKQIQLKEVFPELEFSLNKLQLKLSDPLQKRFYHYKTLKTHILPLTNVAFDKTGNRCITGSYDRTCRVYNVETGTELSVLKGHDNAIFSVGYNSPKWYLCVLSNLLFLLSIALKVQLQ